MEQGGVFRQKPRVDISINLAPIFLAEMIPIELRVRDMLNFLPDNKTLRVLSDSQAPLKAELQSS